MGNEAEPLEDNGQPEEQVIKSDRDIAIELIVEKNEAALNAESENIRGDDKVEEENVLVAGVANDDAGQKKEKEKNEDPLHEVKINGETKTITLKEALASYQKQAAADQYLHEAKKIKREAEVALQEVQAMREADLRSAQDVAGEESGKSKIRDALNRLLSGDEDGAVDALYQATAVNRTAAEQQRRQPEAVDVAQIIAQVTAEVKQQSEVESAYNELKIDYPELFETDEKGIALGAIADKRLHEYTSHGVPRTQAFRKAVEETAALFGISKQNGRQDQSLRTARDEKLEQKARLTQVSQAGAVAGIRGGNSRAMSADEERQEVVREMANLRLPKELRMQ